MKKVFSIKLKGITIMDTMVAMVISGVVIGMASTFFSGLAQTVSGFHSTSEEATAYQQFLFLMKRDFDKAVIVTATEEGVKTENGDKNSFAEYSFRENYILRNQEGIQNDTIPLQPVETGLFFESIPAVPGNLVDRVSIIVKSEYTQMHFCWKKEYSRAFLINREQNGR